MKTMRLFPLELKRLLQSRLTWLTMALTVLSPVLGLVLYKPATSTTMLSMYLANPAIAGGVAGAILLPVGLEYNKTIAGERYRAVGKAMGVKGIDEMNDAQAADSTIAAVKQLSADVGIPTNLHGILKEEDIQFLAESAFADACRPGNPRDTSVEEIVELYKSQL